MNLTPSFLMCYKCPKRPYFPDYNTAIILKNIGQPSHIYTSTNLESLSIYTFLQVIQVGWEYPDPLPLPIRHFECPVAKGKSYSCQG